MNKERFILELEKLGIDVDNVKLERLALFYKLLVEWNEKINLTTIVLEEEVYLKHFYDSLTLFKCIDLKGDLSLCDVGSGAGFPGIVLKIFFPNLKITLVDSLNKRVNYLNTIISSLELDGIRAVHCRMEDFSRLHEEEFDIITARAVANLSVLSEISVRALKIGGMLVFMKANCDEELANFGNVCSKLSLSVEAIHRFLLPIENSNRTLICIKKNGKTNVKFPRTIDKIKRNSL